MEWRRNDRIPTGAGNVVRPFLLILPKSLNRGRRLNESLPSLNVAPPPCDSFPDTRLSELNSLHVADERHIKQYSSRSSCMVCIFTFLCQACRWRHHWCSQQITASLPSVLQQKDATSSPLSELQCDDQFD